MNPSCECHLQLHIASWVHTRNNTSVRGRAQSSRAQSVVSYRMWARVPLPWWWHGLSLWTLCRPIRPRTTSSSYVLHVYLLPLFTPCALPFDLLGCFHIRSTLGWSVKSSSNSSLVHLSGDRGQTTCLAMGFLPYSKRSYTSSWRLSIGNRFFAISIIAVDFSLPMFDLDLFLLHFLLVNTFLSGGMK
jgi:hypothetical protein